jgi:hypothetical protein
MTNVSRRATTRGPTVWQRSARLPWIPLFNRDWLGSPVLARMTAEQEGVLLRLALHAWELPGCIVPDDDETIGTMVKVFVGGPEYERVVRPVLAACCERLKGGYRIVEPLALHDLVARAEHTRQKRQRAGRASALARAARFGTAQPSKSNTRSASARTNVREDSNTRSEGNLSNTCSESLEQTGDGAGHGAGAGVEAGGRTVIPAAVRSEFEAQDKPVVLFDID